MPAVRPDGTITPVHSCGHGPIADGVVGAALGLATLRKRLAGRIVVLGCPADETHAPGTIARGGGKEIAASAGLLDDVDAALYAHPEFVNTVSLESRWMRRGTVHVFGSRSLEDGVTQFPLVALSDLMAAVGLSDPSQVLLEYVRLDGDVEEGTGLVLDATVIYFADDEGGIDSEAHRSWTARWLELPNGRRHNAVRLLVWS